MSEVKTNTNLLAQSINNKRESIGVQTNSIAQINKVISHLEYVTQEK